MVLAAGKLQSFPLQDDPVGYAWSKEVATNWRLKQDYDRVGNKRETQHRFRQKWAQEYGEDLIASITTTNKKVEGYEEIDETMGDIVSIAKIFRDEGGESSNATIRNDGILATRNYVNWCLKQEHAVAWNAATKRCDFLQLSKKYKKYSRRAGPSDQ